MKEFKPIAMRCNQQQYNEIKQILIDNGCKCDLDRTFDERPYLTNNFNLNKNNIHNTIYWLKGHYNRTVFETWNKNTFLEYCGIEIKNNKTDFIVGKWYKYNNNYTKFLKTENEVFLGTEHIINNKFTKNDIGNWIFGVNNNITLLTDLTEIQPYLPDNHPDKVSKQPDLNELLEYAKKHYPAGTKFELAHLILNKEFGIIPENCEIEYSIEGTPGNENIFIKSNNTYLKNKSNYSLVIYHQNRWAEIIEPAKPVETKSIYQIAAEKAMERFKDIQIGDEYVAIYGDNYIAERLPRIVAENIKDCYIDCGASYLWKYDKPDKFGYKINKQNSEYPLTPNQSFSQLAHLIPDPLISLQGIGYENSSLFDSFDYKSNIKEIQPIQLIKKKKIVMDTKINPTQSINTNLKIKNQKLWN